VVGVTDSHGHFRLDNVPAGADIPLVMQTGKFRRAVTIPMVNACQDNLVNQKDAGGVEQLARLPRNQQEGHLPLIAVTTGACEGLECVLRTFGFDDAEFTGGTGTGRIHLYRGADIGRPVGGAPDSMDAYKYLWGSSNLYKYDMVLNSCECAAVARDWKGPGYTNMQQYLDHGGRMYATDFQYNWFTDPQAPAVFKTVADWMPLQMAPQYKAPYFIDTSFPKGQALNDWLQFVFQMSGPPPMGQVHLDNLFYNVTAVNPGATRWIYNTSDGMPAAVTAMNYTAKYLSFNTPFNANPEVEGGPAQCGRAVFTDIHVSALPGMIQSIVSSDFPTGCEALQRNNQTTAFEFLFFDLGSCVQNDNNPPSQPPVI
jgi:hypothetical protein